MILLAAALVASLQVRHVSVPAGTDGGVVRIECPVGQTTRIVFPERFLGLKVSAGALEAMGLVPEASSPRGVLRVRPISPTPESRVRAQGPSGSLVVILRSVPHGRGSEIRLAFAPAQADATPGPSASPSPTPAPPAPAIPEATEPVAPSPPPPAQAEVPRETSASADLDETVATNVAESPSEAPLSSKTAALATLDAAALLRATPVRIGRREGRPGQREMVLDDALKGESFVWLRFTLKKGAKRRVTRVWWAEGDVESLVQEARGEDLALVVQLPRAPLKPDSKLNIAVPGEGEYRFALKDSSFVSFVKGLFY